MSLGRVQRSGSRELKPRSKPGEQVARRKELRPCRDELDREREPVEPLAQLGDVAAIDVDVDTEPAPPARRRARRPTPAPAAPARSSSSPARWSRSRLVTRTARLRAARRQHRPSPAAPATTCSKLSRTSSIAVSPTCVDEVAGRVQSPRRSPGARAPARAATPARRTTTPSGKASCEIRCRASIGEPCLADTAGPRDREQPRRLCLGSGARSVRPLHVAPRRAASPATARVTVGTTGPRERARRPGSGSSGEAPAARGRARSRARRRARCAPRRTRRAPRPADRRGRARASAGRAGARAAGARGRALRARRRARRRGRTRGRRRGAPRARRARSSSSRAISACAQGRR